MNRKINFINTSPVKLSALQREIEQIERSGIYSNYGPMNALFERKLVDDIFDGVGACVTNCNATIGLMLAIKEAVQSANRTGRYALMPSFTFAATAHAALWAGLTPLLCDIDSSTWSLNYEQINELVERYGEEIAVIVPYATFGTNIDLDYYERVFESTGIPTVVDAAASLGSLNTIGDAFGKGFNQSIVYSMHVTKTFSTYEGGVLYSNDHQRVRRLRAMGNFGFESPRISSLPGLNAKLTEIGALMGIKKLDEFKSVVQKRSRKAELYKSILHKFEFQHHTGQLTAYQFLPVLLDPHLAPKRQKIIEGMATREIIIANYFSPHIAEQPYFEQTCKTDQLTVTNDIASRIISLPLYELMTDEEVEIVSRNFHDIVSEFD